MIEETLKEILPHSNITQEIITVLNINFIKHVSNQVDVYISLPTKRSIPLKQLYKVDIEL